MKKIFALIFCIMTLVLCLSFSASADSDIKITLNGTPIDCASYGQEATIVDGRTLVPLRAIFESLGASVEWDGKTKTVTSTLKDTTIRLTIGENKLYKNSTEVELDVPAKILNGRTMVPARAVAESFGVSVGWSAKNRTVVLMTMPDVPLAKYNADIENRLAKYVPKEAVDNEILGTVGGFVISGSCVRYATMIGQSYLEYYGLSQQEVEDLATGIYKENAGLLAFAYKNYITVTDEEIGALAETTIENLEYMYGDVLEETLASSPYTKYYYCLYAVYSQIYNKLAEVFVNSNEMKAQLAPEFLAYLSENDYVRAKHILIQFPEGEYGEVTDKQRAEALKKANEVLKQVNAMSDLSEFDELIKKYNEDPGMESNPDGYFFTKGVMVEPFEKATYSLGMGQTSGIVETSYGYHIILRLPLDDEAVYESDVYQEFVSDKLTEMIQEESDSMEIVYAGNYDERVEDFINEFSEMSYT